MTILTGWITGLAIRLTHYPTDTTIVANESNDQMINYQTAYAQLTTNSKFKDWASEFPETIDAHTLMSRAYLLAEYLDTSTYTWIQI